MIVRPKVTQSLSLLTDLAVVIFFSAIIFSIVRVGEHWRAPLQSHVEIDLSLWRLPGYTFYSLLRGFLAYGLSLGFALTYGYVAAHRPKAEKVMLPLLDVLQSIPVLGFLPGAVLALVALFPTTNVGLELASILMIFTGQVWNLAFSFYQSLRSIPGELQEVSRLYQFSRGQRFLRAELPSSAVALAWNSMLAMAGGWFFLMICEAFTLGNRDYRLPGLGAYISVAIAKNNRPALVAGIVAMIGMIISVDTFVWKPLIAWTQKFRVEESSGMAETSRIGRWFLNSRILQRTGLWFSELITTVLELGLKLRPSLSGKTRARFFSLLSYVLLGVGILFGLWSAWRLASLLLTVEGMDWVHVLEGSALTLLRVSSVLVLGSLWTIPAGVWIGRSESLTAKFRPFVQVSASFPAPILYPLIFMGLHFIGWSPGSSAIILMLLGTQWYILFNVIAGASSVASDIREVAQAYHFTPLQMWLVVWWPAIFPFLVTGWVTAAGGAWNASIVAEYLSVGQKTYVAPGLGSLISMAAFQGRYDLLAASVLTMAILVAFINRFFWKRLYRIAELQYAQ